MLLIGFGNKARHGKDTAAEAVRDYYNQKNDLFLRHGQLKGIKHVGIYKFATVLYQEVNTFLRVYNGQDNVGTWHNYSPGFDSNGNNIIIPEWVTPDPNPQVSELAPYGKHPKLLQWWGTEFRRAQDPDYWVKKLFASIPTNTDIALVSDVRFPNEADSITQRGGYNVNVTRIRNDGYSYQSEDRSPSHPSEIALDAYNWQFRLTNQERHKALLEEQAITLAEYLRGLK
jgi:hypothetical protein